MDFYISFRGIFRNLLRDNTRKDALNSTEHSVILAGLIGIFICKGKEYMHARPSIDDRYCRYY